MGRWAAGLASYALARFPPSIGQAAAELAHGLVSIPRELVRDSPDRPGSGQQVLLPVVFLCCPLPCQPRTSRVLALPKSIATRERRGAKAWLLGRRGEMCKGYLTINAINRKINTSVLLLRSRKLRNVKVSLCWLVQFLIDGCVLRTCYEPEALLKSVGWSRLAPSVAREELAQHTI